MSGEPDLLPPLFVAPLPAELSDAERRLMPGMAPAFDTPLTPEQRMHRGRVVAMVAEFQTKAMAAKDEEIAKAKETVSRQAREIGNLVHECAALKIQLQQSAADLRACQEQRGIYENKKITALVLDVAAKERALAEASERQTELATALDAAKNELVARTIAAQATEREKRELMAAAVLTANGIQGAVQHLTNTRDDIDDRYGSKIPDFTEAMRQGIVNALACLPK